MLPTRHPAVVFKPVEGGAILLHADDDIYFGLNAVGARAWELLPPRCMVLDQLCREIRQSFPDADPGMIWTDIVELLDDLISYGLILPQSRSERAGRPRAAS